MGWKTMVAKNNAKRNIRIIGALLAVFIVGGYALFQAKNIILGPIVSIESPLSGGTIRDTAFEIRGKAKNIAAITLNDSPIFVDEEGRFNERLTASSGYSIMKLSVRDRFGRTKTEYLHLFTPHKAPTEDALSVSLETFETSSSSPLQATSTHSTS